MHSTVEECALVYLELVCGYVTWIKEKREGFARSYGQAWVDEIGSDVHRFPPFLKGALLSWNLELRTIERVLGLTPEEVAKIDREYGVERYEGNEELSYE